MFAPIVNSATAGITAWCIDAFSASPPVTNSRHWDYLLLILLHSTPMLSNQSAGRRCMAGSTNLQVYPNLRNVRRWMNRTQDILNAPGPVERDDFDVFVPVSILFYGFLQIMWVLDDFQFLYWFGYLLVFTTFLFLSVLVRRAVVLKGLYEELSWQRGKTWTDRTASRNALYSVHIVSSALFMTVAKFDWIHDNLILAVLFVGFSIVALGCALATLFPTSIFERITRFMASHLVSVFVWLMLVGVIVAVHFHDIREFVENQNF